MTTRTVIISLRRAASLRPLVNLHSAMHSHHQGRERSISEILRALDPLEMMGQGALSLPWTGQENIKEKQHL